MPAPSITIALTAAALALAPACAQNYASGLPASGEPLSYDWSTWRQGKTAIDEHDYYRIAGERDLADQIQHQRERGILYNQAGLILAGVGILGLGATFTTSGTTQKIGQGLIVALPIGGVMAFYGRFKAHKRPIVSGRRAREVGDRYNAHVGEQP